MKYLKYIGGLLVFLFAALLANAQADSIYYFKKTYQSDTTHGLSGAALPIADGYLVVGDGIKQLSDGSKIYHIYLRKTDKQGNGVWEKSIDTSDKDIIGAFTVGEQFIKTNDNHFMCVYNKEREYDTNLWNIYLKKFDADGNCILSKEYSFDGAKSALVYQIKYLKKDGTYLLFGTIGDQDKDTQGYYALKVDSLGEVIWENTYYGADTLEINIAKGTHCVELENGTIVLSGYVIKSFHEGYYDEELNTDIPDYFDVDAYLVGIHPFGAKLWERYYGSKFSDYGASVAALPNNHLLVCMAKPTDYNGFWIDGFMYNFEIDEIGNIVWEQWHTDFSEYYSNIVHNPIVLQDGSFVSIALGSYNAFYPQSYLIKFDPTGNIVWSKILKIEPYFLVSKSQYASDIEQTADGGFLISGYQYAYPQMAWLVKTDSEGNTCWKIGCDSLEVIPWTVGTDETFPPLDAQGGVSISPNPATNELWIYFDELPKAAKINIDILDTQGTILRQIQTMPTQQVRLKLDDLPAGIYYCRIAHLNQTAKFVKL